MTTVKITQTDEGLLVERVGENNNYDNDNDNEKDNESEEGTSE